jgi:hypothetical protein
MADPQPDGLTVPVPNPTQVIDGILVPPAWQIRSRSVVVLSASDHAAVFMEVTPR